MCFQHDLSQLTTCQHVNSPYRILCQINAESWTSPCAIWRSWTCKLLVLLVHETLHMKTEPVIAVRARLISVRHWKTPETVIGLSNHVALCQSSHLALRRQDSCLKKAPSYRHNCPLNGCDDDEKETPQVEIARQAARFKSHLCPCSVGCAKHRKTIKISTFPALRPPRKPPRMCVKHCQLCDSVADHMPTSKPTT